VVGVAGPPSTDLERLYEGIEACARAHGTAVVGGDLSTAREIVVAVAVAGHVAGEPGPVLRSGAGAGERLVVTGPLGAGAAGLRTLRARHTPTRTNGDSPSPDQVRRDRARTDAIGDALVLAHCRPRARLVEGEAARVAGATALIDVSDGLVAEVGHIADASGVGFVLEDVPVAPGATLDEALGGGDDYELVMAVPDLERLEAEFERAGLRPPLVIGRCTGDPTERTLDGAPVPSTGWEHPWG
jgi:thiamine-monophosphate kinase